jgi:ubiquinone/menaquinone biosynthesis C-methylase UbiE
VAAVRDPQSFDHLPAHFDRFAELVGADVDAYLMFRLPAAAGGRAVDLGCGTGVHTAVLAERYKEVLAIDLSEPMLAWARGRRARSNIRYEQRDLSEVTVERDGPFDLIFSAYTLHHVPDLEAALQQMRRMLRPGGQIVVVDVVDDRRRVPRGWLRRQALRAFAEDLRTRRRPPLQALELLRLQLAPAWLDHVTTDQLLPPTEWEAIGRAVFPDAVFTPLYRARALHWINPTGFGAP